MLTGLLRQFRHTLLCAGGKTVAELKDNSSDTAKSVLVVGSDEVDLPTKCDEGATLPRRGSQDAAGLDLFARDDCEITAYGKAMIDTGVRVQVPRGHYGRIAPRSGVSWRTHTTIGAGVIDPDYRGSIWVVMFNHSSSRLKISKGQAIAQFILEKISTPVLRLVSEL